MVTGASSGIGQAYVERLAADGWRLLVVARRHDRLEDLAERIRTAHGVATRAIQADLSRSEDLRRACQEIETGPVDMLINDAGLGHYMPFTELPPRRARESVDLNALAPVLLTRAAVEGMIARGGGSVINVASILAFSGTSEASFLPKRAVYAATKSFLVTFSEVLASEVVPLGVRVQVVCPGVVRSEFHSRQGLDMSAVPRMEPDQVVDASLTDLANGVVVSVPGLADVGALIDLEAASEALVSVARTADLPARYRIKPV
jgi:short-subunit dehydrogenase